MSEPQPSDAHPSTPTHRPSRRSLLTGLGAVATLGSLSVVAATRSEAAPAGTYAIGATPVPLNQPSDPLMGTAVPAADAPERGMFGPQVAWPLIPLHAAVARNGQVVTFGTPLNSTAQGGLVYDVWNVAAGFGGGAHVQDPSAHNYNSFCNSMVALPDGRLLMVGGNSTTMTMTYDPVTRAQEMYANLAYQRWYATALRLPDDRVLVMGGGDYYNTRAYQNPTNQNGVATIPEIGTGLGAWTALTGAASTVAFGAEDNRWWYPRAFNGPRGQVVGISGDRLWTISTANRGSVTALGRLPFNPRVSGSQVMFAPGRVLVAGGGQPFNEDGTTATNAAAVVDFTTATPRVTSVAAMAWNRNWLNLTVLPTGEVLANGGTRVGTQGGDANSVRQAEVFDPGTGRWRTAATAARTRTYHSTALLLPSGAVFTGGGGAPGPEDNLNIELFYPSYLFARGADGVVRWASRPAIEAISGSATLGGTLTLKLADTRGIRAVSLISLPSVTHSENTDQRRVPLSFTQNGATVVATVPNSTSTLPPADYLLTVVDQAGVPSPGQVVTFRRGAAGLVTVGSAVQVSEGGSTGGAPTGSVALTPDSAVGLEAVNFPGMRVQHENFAAYLRAAGTGSSTAVKNGTSWSVRPGLASADGVSFESLDWPGYYLTAPAGAGAVQLVRNDGSTAVATRATFAAVTGATGQNTSFEVWGNRGLRLRHANYQLFAQPADTSDLGRADSTFVVRAALSPATPVPLAVGRTIGLEAENFPGQRVQHENFAAYLRAAGTGSAAAVKNGTSWVVRPGLASTDWISLESLDWPGWVLASPDVSGGGAVAMVRDDGSAALAARATFCPVTGASGQNTTLQVFGNRSLVLRHTGFRLYAQPADLVALGRADSTFVIRSGLAPAPTR
ncbi:AbfB domain-containing protein [Kineococcus gynurae]|uniref:AbfB domain-containing protein n=1 Tax=Kineococcus gynurae TaxID=452979 RepID=A0ABV5LSN7_9ACTN